MRGIDRYNAAVAGAGGAGQHLDAVYVKIFRLRNVPYLIFKLYSRFFVAEDAKRQAS
jgi:hypothetical protein